MRFRLVSYNIHKGIGGIDRQYRLERIIAVLAHYQPDIVLLQEVDEDVPRSRHDRQVTLITEALGLSHYAYQRNVSLTRGHYGNATLSRFPLSVVKHVDLTIPLKKRRRALITRCRLHLHKHQRSMLLANVHLGLAGFERRLQLAKLLASDIVRHSHRSTPLIVGGDYNDVWNSLGQNVMYPAGFLSAGGRILTFPAALPMRALDHVFYRGDLQSRHAFASRLQLAHEASDHLPLIADFKLIEHHHPKAAQHTSL